jgi:hypothetical protein
MSSMSLAHSIGYLQVQAGFRHLHSGEVCLDKQEFMNYKQASHVFMFTHWIQLYFHNAYCVGWISYEIVGEINT